MDYESEFLRSIPLFLRRLEAPGRGPRPSERGLQPTGQRPAKGEIGPAAELRRPPAQAQLPLEEARKATPVAPVVIDDPAIVSIDDHRPLSLRNLGPAQTEPASTEAGASLPPPVSAALEDRDAAFQVTLPRSVIQQIRLLAAHKGTTHRAIILQSLRIAGLSVPDGADVDRRALAARRREQARKTAPDRSPREASPQPRHAHG